MKQLIETVGQLEAAGVKFRSITENIGTDSTGGRFVFHIFGAGGIRAFATFAVVVKRLVNGWSTTPLVGKVAIAEAYNIGGRKGLEFGTLEEFKQRLATAVCQGLLEFEQCDPRALTRGRGQAWLVLCRRTCSITRGSTLGAHQGVGQARQHLSLPVARSSFRLIWPSNGSFGETCLVRVHLLPVVVEGFRRGAAR